MSLLRRIEKSLDQRLRAIFSGGEQEPGAREAVELYRDALDQIANRAMAGKRGDRIFPFNLITIELAVENAERKAVLETLFDPGQLGDDIRATLKEERVTPPTDLTVAVRYPEGALVEMRVICERGKNEPLPAATPVSPRSCRGRSGSGASGDNHGRFLLAPVCARTAACQPGTGGGDHRLGRQGGPPQ